MQLGKLGQREMRDKGLSGYGISTQKAARRWQPHPEGMPDGSRRSQRSEDLRSDSEKSPHPGGVPESRSDKFLEDNSLASLRDASPHHRLSGGLRYAATSGYRLATLRVATAQPPVRTNLS